MKTVTIRTLILSPGAGSAALLYGSVALVCTRIPLLNYLGYEFSALFALLAGCVSGLLTLGPVKDASHGEGDTPDPRATAGAVGVSAAANLLLLALPLVIISGNALSLPTAQDSGTSPRRSFHTTSSTDTFPG